MKSLKKIAGILSMAQRNFCAVLLFLMVFLNFVEISRRFLFAKSFVWVQEISLIMLCWLVYIGVAYIYGASSLLNVDFLYEKSRGLVRLVWNISTHFLVLCVLILLAVFGWKFAIVQSAARTYALHLPNSLYSLPLVLSSVFMMLSHIIKVHIFFAEYLRGREEKGKAA
jgi:TRAP-type C4-dicarboxylate transport system permease small subunit